jgi:hypothetical protein
MSRSSLSFIVTAGCMLALGAGGTAASAADLTTGDYSFKDAPVAVPSLDVHGFATVTINSEFVNPQGQVLTRGGNAPVLDAGLSVDVYKGGGGYKDGGGFIDKITVYGAIEERFWNGNWHDGGYWGNFQPNANGAWYENDWALGASVTFAKNWTLDASMWQFFSEDANKITNTGVAYPAGQLAVFALSYDDSWTGFPITFNPYVKLWYEFAGQNNNGQSQICFSCKADDYDFFVGMTPTMSMARYGMPYLTLQAPTFITVGPESFWDLGPAFTHAPCANTHSCGDIGYFQTGLTAVWDLKSIVPANYGKWNLQTGVQFKDLINDNLVADEKASVGTSQREITNVFVALGMSF